MIRFAGVNHTGAFMRDANETHPAAERTLFRQAFLRHVSYTLGETVARLSPHAALRATALAVRDRMLERLWTTEERYRRAGAKRLHYLSLEFLIGRSLVNNLVNLGLLDTCRSVLREVGFDPQAVEEGEVDAALGNGGLGRLAACFLDSLATLDMPGFGYGIDYEFGLFRQELRNGEQVEKPDIWRDSPSPWLVERPNEAVLIPLYGRIESGRDRFGTYNPMWLDWRVVIGVPADLPIVGYGGKTVNYLRLFAARASHEFDMSIFNEGDYIRAVQEKVQSETVSKILYPSESGSGRELRLIQEYFLVACAVRDIVRTYRRDHADFERLPDRVAIQLNDTHPALTVAELMRTLVDENDLPWEKAWDITTATCAYTNHTLAPEALERWPVALLEKVLPRHLQIIYEINRRFLDRVGERWPGDTERLRRMSLIDEDGGKQVRMAHLAVVGSHSVNGVAAVHTELVKTELVPDFHQLWPEKFNNKTNGVTPRRWLLAANPGLAQLLTDAIGSTWVADLDRLRDLEPLATDRGFQQRFAAIKRANKERLAAVIKESTGEVVDPASLFDVQVKRIHEYKRQLLNLLHIIHEYLAIVDDGRVPAVPRTYVFAGKAAPGYFAAKQIIRLINDVARVVNRDRRARDLMRVVFVPDYRVTLAELIIPAGEVSEQISAAGTEASGTSNMKFALNGALTVGSLDGANIEIRDAVGAENTFIFGLTVADIRHRRAAGPYRPWDAYQHDETVRRVLDTFAAGQFCPESPGRHDWVRHKLLAENEPYFHVADLPSYLEAHAAVADLHRRTADWNEKAILNVARCGRFSSDRTVREYARGIWTLTAVPPGADEKPAGG
jgi:starch phosphorylase